MYTALEKLLHSSSGEHLEAARHILQLRPKQPIGEYRPSQAYQVTFQKWIIHLAARHEPAPKNTVKRLI